MKARAPFDDFEAKSFGTIYLDPPWQFRSWTAKGTGRSAEQHYPVMSTADLASLPVIDLAAEDAVMVMWISWPLLPDAMHLISAYGFEYKTCAFCWIKADISQMEMFRDDADVQIGLGYWSRSNSEVALLATRGNPHRLNSDVRQGIIEPRRQHSRKPSCVYDRIERLLPGPYIELFSRTSRPGWSNWGNEVGKFTAE